jgi:multicomponent Na+:H+ antiporter subunit B
MISVIEPIILIYAMYVLFHGEISLGGGFQAGALIGMVYLLDIMVAGRKKPIFNLPKARSAALAGLGPFIYALTGLVTIAGGGLYLEYNKMPVPVHQAELHSIGITAVEIGVTIGVAGTIITILNALTERISFDDDDN